MRSHEDLVAWQLSEQLKDRVYEIVARPAAREDRDFCDDIRRSARSAPANLSEGFGRYRPRDNARFVRTAIASLIETINHLGHARKQQIISEQEHRDFVRLGKRARGAAIGYLRYLNSCPPDGPKHDAEP
jgi:four helix bundle protein